jgi:hypothetical protein
LLSIISHFYHDIIKIVHFSPIVSSHHPIIPSLFYLYSISILSLLLLSQVERRLRQLETEGKAAQLGWEDERLRLTQTIQTMETQVP